jgi:hypothetical protein
MEYTNRVTNDEITELGGEEIFVFGSNLSGIHGGGAAKLALDEFGAKWGQATGMQGQTYAIPTKSEGIERTLTIDEIEPHVDEFIQFALEFPSLTFFVTEIGCGLAGHAHEDIAPLFKRGLHIRNIHFPQKFWEVLLK